MNAIDLTQELKTLVSIHPFLARLSDRMGAFLTQVANAADQFQNDEDSNLGHLEEKLKKPASEFLASALGQAAQHKSDACGPNCPTCGRKLIRRQKLERSISAGVSEFKLTRVSGYCVTCKKWVVPADEKLGVESGYTPQTEEAAALLASKMPVGEASSVLERLTGIKIPPATLDRLAKRTGEKAKTLRREQDEQARAGGERLEAQAVKHPPETLVIMLDAWNIRERDQWGESEQLRSRGQEPKRWHWVWTGTVFGLDKRVEKSGRAMITQRAYVSTREGQESFSQQLHAEALRQGLGRSKRVLIMGDGAVWIWNLAADRFKGALQRVDLYHVKQHLWVVAKELFADPTQAKAWVKKMKNRLRRGQTGKVLNSIEEAIQESDVARGERLKKERGYFKENQKRMDYASGEKRGEPLGTGAIESTCRQYQCRFKRPGQFWTQKGDEALLCLETLWRNARWDRLFPHTKCADPSKN